MFQVWRNFFSSVETDTSGGGVNISEPTPNTGAGLGTFPLYRRAQQFEYKKKAE